MANWFSRLFAGEPPDIDDPSYRGPDASFWYGATGATSFSGVNIRPETALAVSAVYGCIRVLRESLGSLPFKVFKRTGDKTVEPARDHFGWRLLQRQPNGWMTAQEWKEMGVMHICLRGNFYSRIVGSGLQTQLLPLSPDRVKPKQRSNGRISYEYTPSGGETEIIDQENMLHVRGMSLDGISGLSILGFARNSVGSSVVQEKHGSTLFGKGAVPPFWIKRPAGRRWTKEAIDNFRKNWRRVQAGPENAANPPILQDDMELHALPISNRDLQYIEGRSFNAEEICGFFGVHPALVFKTGETAGNNEEIAQQFKTFTLGPLGTRFEQSIDRDVIDDDDYFSKFNYDGLTKATMKDRYEAHNIAVQGGWKLVNEVRANEDMNPIPGGDESRFPLNMQPAGGGPDRNEQGGEPGKGNPKGEEAPKREPPPFPTKKKQGRRSTKAVFRVLLKDAACRIANTEISALSKRASRAKEDHALWGEWATKVYNKHEMQVNEILCPICEAWLTRTRIVHQPHVLASEVRKLSKPVFEEDRDIEAMLKEWSKTRWRVFYDLLIGVFFNETV